MNSSISKLVKDNIKREIKKQGRTVTEVCTSMGMRRTYISDITDRTNLLKIHAIAQELNVPLHTLLNFDTPHHPTTGK